MRLSQTSSCSSPPFNTKTAYHVSTRNTFTVPGSSAPLTVQVFFDGNAPGSTPPALTHPAISTTIASLVKRLSAHASGSPLQRAEQASVDGTMAEIRPETGTSGTGLNYGDTVHAMTALQRFLKDKKVGEEIDFVVDGALHGGDAGGGDGGGEWVCEEGGGGGEGEWGVGEERGSGRLGYRSGWQD